ncbi:outer membrane esterase [Buttiauxella gaviniae ATCC 51604]|uniref:Outer membrane esterase n=1 Tax=Buttiauxella gaviniae ATCC 51604 TaxID=1354253 RepID=A0A1B7HK62_9ENTR|nr:autotransporter domain-containing protein [Buttiauxella gaviniae]OAT16005.1 outer membrane esterase [Buttiauxella gaviniae ATCC 51604]
MVCKKIFTLSTLAVITNFSSPALAFNSLTVFGDSLSDTGNNGRWIWNNNQNKLYDEKLAAQYGIKLTPSDQGGSNYAAGGATAVPTLNSSDNTHNQVQQWLSQTGGKADKNGLYIHWVGGNDLAAASTQPALARSIATSSAVSASAQIGALLGAGAGLVVVPTVPDISATPFLLESVISAGFGPAAASAIQAAFISLNAAQTPDLASRQQAIQQALRVASSTISNNPQIQQSITEQLIAAYDTAAAQSSMLTDYYNAVQEKALEQHGGNIARVDINSLFKEILAAPQAFGLSNSAGMACPPGVASTDCTTSTSGFSRTQDYLFSDHFHPGPQVHNIMAQYIQSIIAAPVQVSRLNQGIQEMVRGSRATLDSRYEQLRDHGYSPGTLGIFGGYGGSYRPHNDNNESSNGGENTNSLTLGADYQVNDNILLGALIAGSLDKQRADSNFHYDTQGFQAALFSHLRLGQTWLDGDVHYLAANFTDIRRDITLGKLARSEEGKTDGKFWGARLTAGYDFTVTNWLTMGPMFQYIWDYSQVDGYREKSNSSTSMRFGSQNGHSQVGSTGWRFNTHIGGINPWTRVNYRHQFGDDVYSANGGLKSTNLGFSRTGEKQDKDWLVFAIGADMPLSETVSAFAAMSQTGGLSSGNQTSYNIGISAKF